MSESKGNVLFLLMMIINLVGGLVCLFGNVLIITSDLVNLFMKVSSVLSVLALIAGMAYIFMGCKKSAVKFFRGFMALYALNAVANIANASQSEIGTASTPVLGLLVNAVVFGLLIVMSVGEDLGKKKSFLVAGLIFAFGVASLIYTIVIAPGVAAGGSELGSLYIIRSAANLCLASMMGVMTFAKYRDKTRRGTK